MTAKVTVRKGKDGKPRKTYETNFPKSRDNPVCHVRPHARDFLDAAPLPERDKATGLDRFEKQCLWLSHSFIKAIVFGRMEEYLAEAKKKKAKKPSKSGEKKDHQK